MRSSFAVSIVAFLVVGLLAGRGGLAAAPKKKVVGPPEVAWKDMTWKQRDLYMEKVVNPKMKALFQEHDPDHFKKFNCATCHGQGAKARKFKMPSPDLHPLPNTPEAFQAALKEKASWPEWTKFMVEKVTPAMAALLGTHAFDPKKPEAGGFSCGACHRLEAPAATLKPEAPKP